MTKEDILNYVMNTPNNTNRMVLSNMLDKFNSGSGATIVHITDDGDDLVLDMTAAELLTVAHTGPVILSAILDGGIEDAQILTRSTYNNSEVVPYCFQFTEGKFYAASGDIYPTSNPNGGGSSEGPD